MNPLAKIKEKLMIKPNVEERERVAVVIKGVKRQRIAKPKMEELEQVVEEEPVIEEKEEKAPLIVDETDRGFDRSTLLLKLADSKRNKVTIKPIVQVSQEARVSEPVPLPIKENKAKKIAKKLPLIIEDDEEEVEKEEEEEFIMKPKTIPMEDENVIAIRAPEKKKRITKKLEKGIAILGPEVLVEIGDTKITKRMPKKSPPVLIKVSSYYMNNREIFINFINSLFEPYKRELEENKDEISCENIGKTSTNFSLLTHQKLVRDYINLYTPYRGLLLYHGLGSGKTATSIAIAEGMKDSKTIIIMTPASLRANYVEELKKAGDLLYKRNQYWEWISTDNNSDDVLKTLSVLLNLPQEYIRKNKGAFFINVKKPSNYNDLSDTDKKVLEEQLNEMIKQKYKFINYNGLRSQRLKEMTCNFKKNIFDNAVVIIDEAHNLISRIVNKLNKEKPIPDEENRQKRDREEEQKGEEQKGEVEGEEQKGEVKENKKKKKGGAGVNLNYDTKCSEEDLKGKGIFGEHTPLNLATKLYYMLLRAKNVRIVLLSGTPIINYPNEFAILFNILRGYIKTWKIPLVVKTKEKIDRNVLLNMLLGEKSLDYLDYSPSSKVLTITRNPFGFKNKVKKESGYQGVSNVKKDDAGENVIDDDFTTDEDFERKIINILRRNNIDVMPQGIEVINKKALPDNLDNFLNRYIDENDKTLKNVDALKRRIVGLSSYFKSAQENLLPKYEKKLGVDYHVVSIPMSDTQFQLYESMRKIERESEKKKRSKKSGMGDVFEEKTGTMRMFSRLFCNFIIPERPMPKKSKSTLELTNGDNKEMENNMNQILKAATKIAANQDVEDEREGEMEADEILEEIGGVEYKERLDRAIANIEEHSNDFLTPEALQTYSPKFLHILENIQDPDNEGLHLVYSQFRTAEGIGIFCLVLEKNGFARFKIKKNHINVWEIDIPENDAGKPTYALYTGTETAEEKEIIRNIYNGDWDNVPDSIGNELKRKYHTNKMAEVIKVFMITSSGSEGINLKNTRFVHIMEPYWHPVRLEQVIGRARRICSHKDLPVPFQSVEVFVYLMIFSKEQLLSDKAIELKRKDLSKAIPRVPITSDQYLYEISEIKANLTAQLTDAIKQSAFDCYIYSNGKCVNFGDPTNEKFAYVPDFTEQQNDTTLKANKMQIEWTGVPITINGVEYVGRRMGRDIFDLYDKETYVRAMEDSGIAPLKVGTYEINDRGEKVLKLLVV
jgi:hypothetical protein